jgi:hypothetical protein
MILFCTLFMMVSCIYLFSFMLMILWLIVKILVLLLNFLVVNLSIDFPIKKLGILSFFLRVETI